MKKRDLLKLLEPFTDEQELYVDLFSEAYPRGCPGIIQGVEPFFPAYSLGPPLLVGLVARTRDKLFTEEQRGPQPVQ